MGILTWCWHTDSPLRKYEWQNATKKRTFFIPYWPVVVEVTELVGKPLDVIWLQSRGITDDIEMCGRDSPLPHTLAHNEEIIPAHTHTNVVNSTQHNHNTTTTHHSGLVTSESTTVPGGGFLSSPCTLWKMRVLIRFFTTTTQNLGLHTGTRGKGGRSKRSREWANL